MNNFRITILEDDGTMDIYEDVKAIDVNEERIKIEYDDQEAYHLIDCIDEIRFKKNR